MNETLVDQQLSHHQLNQCHPSQQLPKRFFCLCDITHSIYLRIKSLHVLSTLLCGVVALLEANVQHNESSVTMIEVSTTVTANLQTPEHIEGSKFQ